MPLTADQQAQLNALLAEQDAPPYRTQTGIAGVLHRLIDSLSGAVAHRSPEEWAQMAETVEQAAGDGGGNDESGAQPASAEQAGGEVPGG